MKIKTRAKQARSTLLTLVVMLGVFAAMPPTAGAAVTTAEEVASQINSFNHGGSGTLSAAVSDSNITVTGKVSGAVNALSLNLDSSVRVLWKADYSGTLSSASDSLIILDGDGTFEVPSDGSVVDNGKGVAVNSKGTNTVLVSGGTIATSEYVAIMTWGAGSSVTVSSGTVSSVKSCPIWCNGDNTSVTVSGGTVSNTDGASYVIYTRGKDSSITVNGGTVSSAKYIAVYSDGENSSVKVSSGTVNAYMCAIISNGSSSEINISGGIVYNTNPYVNYTTVQSYGVSSAVKISGGFVFGNGTKISGKNSDSSIVIGMDSDSLSISDTAVVCAWNRSAGHTEYAKGTTDDLTVNSEATVKWDKNGSQFGISYAKNANVGFFPLSGIYVDEATIPAYNTPQINNDNTWLWILIGALVIVAIGGGITFIITRQKEKRV